MKNDLSELKKIEIQNLANAFREEAGLPESDPVPDIVQLIQNEGYEYLEESFPNNSHSGFTQATGTSQRFKIGYNQTHAFGIPYKRFTLCHELGHVNIPEHINILTDRTHYSTPEFQSEDIIEREADYFSICLLAPKGAFKNQMRCREFTLEDIKELADHFGISIYAAALRFVELTDLCCSLIMSNTSGIIRFERRSNSMKDQLRRTFLYNEPIPNSTETRQAINQNQSINIKDIQLNSWYPEVSDSIKASESVLIYPHNQTILTFINPATDDFSEEQEDQEGVFLRRS